MKYGFPESAITFKDLDWKKSSFWEIRTKNDQTVHTAHDSMRPALKIGVINLAGLNCAKFRKGLSFFLYDNKKSLLHF